MALQEIAQRRPWGWHGVGVLKPLRLFSLEIQLFNNKQTSMTNWKISERRCDYGVAEACHFLVKLLLLNLFYFQNCYIFFSVLPTPEAFIKQLNTIIYNFLWKGPDKVARPAVINDLKYGGLNLIDLGTSIKSLRLAWLGRLFVERSSPWKAFVNHLLKDHGGIFFFRCNYDLKVSLISSTKKLSQVIESLHFYRDLNT